MARKTPVNTGYSIINGRGTGINGYRIDVWAEYLLGQSDVSKNCTPITVYFYTALNSAYTSATNNPTGLDSALQVGNSKGTGVTDGPYNFTSAENLHLLGSYSGNVTHNADGTGSVQISGSFTTASSYISGGSVNVLVTLPSLTRVTTLGATDAGMGQTSVIALSSQSPEYSHSIAYRFGELTGYIAPDGSTSDQEVIFTATGVPFRVPEEFYSQIPNDTYGTCTLTCRTYYAGELLGEPQTATFVAYAVPDECYPDVILEAEDVNPVTLPLTGDPKRLINYGSTALCKVQATAKHGATIQKVTVGKEELTGQSVEVPVFGLTYLAAVVTDSRGFTCQVEDAQTVFIDYVPVTNLASISRDGADSTATLVFSGSFWNGNFGAVENHLLLQYRVGEGDWITVAPEVTCSEGRYTATYQVQGLEHTRSHTLQVRVTDALSVAEKTLTVQKSTPVFDWGEEDFVFHVPVSAPGLSCPELTQILERLNTLEEKINGSD